MVNIIIYLQKEIEPQKLVFDLLKNKLIANASIDINNVSYRIENEAIVKNENTVITAQTKAMLFSLIEKFINEHYGENVIIYSLPITQANESFGTLIRTKTLKT